MIGQTSKQIDWQTNRDYNFTYLDLSGSSFIKLEEKSLLSVDALLSFICLDFHNIYFVQVAAGPVPPVPRGDDQEQGFSSQGCPSSYCAQVGL